jgi:hypothetical protein
MKFNNKKGYGNQSYNSRPNNQNYQGNRNNQQYQNNQFNQWRYTQNNGFQQNNTRCFCCHKEGHVIKDCPIWKKILENEAKNSTLKVGVNVIMVDWDQLVFDVFVTIKDQKARM